MTPDAGEGNSELAREHCQHRIVAQLVVVVEILIAKRNPEHPLADQRNHLVLDQFRAPHVVKARGQSIHPAASIGRASPKIRSITATLFLIRAQSLGATWRRSPHREHCSLRGKVEELAIPAWPHELQAILSSMMQKMG